MNKPRRPLADTGIYKLGIDTGGTYTDAVLVDEQQKIVAAAKCLTTRHDLTQGIAHALAELPPDALRCTGMVALSTTLSTSPWSRRNSEL